MERPPGGACVDRLPVPVQYQHWHVQQRNHVFFRMIAVKLHISLLTAIESDADFSGAALSAGPGSSRYRSSPRYC